MRSPGALRGGTILVVTALALTACFKGSPPPTAPPPEPPKSTRHVAALGDPLGFLPLDAQVVVVLDLSELKSSSLWKRFEPLLRQRLGTFTTIVEGCYKLDPLVAVRRVSLALSDIKGTLRGVVVIDGFKRDKMMKCLEVVRDGSRGKMTIDRDVITLTEGGLRVAAAFASSTTMVFQFGPQADAATLTATLDGGAPLRMEPSFTELQGRIDPTHPMWLVVRDGTVFSGQTAGLNARSFLISARISDTATANLRLRFDDPAQASSLATTMQAQVGAVAMMFDEITANADDVDLVMTARMSAAQLDSLLTLIGPSLGIP